MNRNNWDANDPDFIKTRTKIKVRKIQSYALLQHMVRTKEPGRLKVVTLTSYKKCPPRYMKFWKKCSM